MLVGQHLLILHVKSLSEGGSRKNFIICKISSAYFFLSGVDYTQQAIVAETINSCRASDINVIMYIYVNIIGVANLFCLFHVFRSKETVYNSDIFR